MRFKSLQRVHVWPTVLFLLAASAHHGFSQTLPLEFDEVSVNIATQPIKITKSNRGTIYSIVVGSPSAPWIRIHFGDVTLGKTPQGGIPTLLRLTSLRDGASQVLNAAHLNQWQNSSAYFNGDSVLVELISDPNADDSELHINTLWVGQKTADGGTASICGNYDDREQSSNPAGARLLSPGCSAWIINDANGCLLTAGHCGPDASTVIQFNVPVSSYNGFINHPPPEDQYVPDMESVQKQLGSTGNDWSYFGCFRNSNTGLTPYEAQNAFFQLADSAPPATNQEVRVTGYGAVSGTQFAWMNQIQKTHTGPLVSHKGTTIRYQVDTTGGDSGSPVVDETSGLAIGIHAQAGCTSSGGSNIGTAVQHPDLSQALNAPKGVCIPPSPLQFVFPDTLPELLSPHGDSVRVEILATNEATPMPGSGFVHYDSGNGFVTVELAEVSTNVYDAVFPPLPCGSAIQYYFTAQTAQGELATSPHRAPEFTHVLVVADSLIEVFHDDFDSDQGWSATSDANLTTGLWERGRPIGGGDRGDPPHDVTGDGMCYLTENQDGDSDIDNGSTTLTSPLIDASASDVYLTYRRWFSNTQGDSPETDVLDVEFSTNGGTDWNELEIVGPSVTSPIPEVDGGWALSQIELGAVPNFVPTNEFRLRFTASDLSGPSIVEAGIDEVKLFAIECEDVIIPCAADLNQTGLVNVDDLLVLFTQWGACSGCVGDISPTGGDNQVNVNDIIALISAWGPCL